MVWLEELASVPTWTSVISCYKLILCFQICVPVLPVGLQSLWNLVLESKTAYQKSLLLGTVFVFLSLLVKCDDSYIPDALEKLIRRASAVLHMKTLQFKYDVYFKPSVVYILPDALNTDHPSEVPEKLIQDRFRKLSCFPEAFSSIHYKGTRTYNPPTDFSGLRRAVEQQLENNTTRSPRQPGVIYKALKVSPLVWR